MPNPSEEKKKVPDEEKKGSSDGNGQSKQEQKIPSPPSSYKNLSPFQSLKNFVSQGDKKEKPKTLTEDEQKKLALEKKKLEIEKKELAEQKKLIEEECKRLKSEKQYSDLHVLIFRISQASPEEKHNLVEEAKKLLKEADLSSIDYKGRNPLHAVILGKTWDLLLPLMEEIRNKSKDQISKILQQEAQDNDKSRTALEYILGSSLSNTDKEHIRLILDMAKVLINIGAQIDFQNQPIFRVKILNNAAVIGHLETVKLILQSQKKDVIALHETMDGMELHASFQEVYEDVYFQALIEANKLEKRKRYAPLHMLVKQAARPNADKKTLLSVAKRSIKNGADFGARDYQDRTPLHIAVITGDWGFLLSFLKALKELEVEKAAKRIYISEVLLKADNTSKNVLEYLLVPSIKKESEEQKKDVLEIARSLINLGAKVAFDDNADLKVQLLNQAAEFDEIKLVKLIFHSQQADLIALHDKFDDALLDASLKEAYREAYCDALLGDYKVIQFSVMANPKGYSLLHLIVYEAVRQKNHERKQKLFHKAETLVNFAMNVSVVDYKNQTPLHVAAMTGMWDFLKLFLSALGNIDPQDVISILRKEDKELHRTVLEWMLVTTLKTGRGSIDVAQEQIVNPVIKGLIEHGAKINFATYSDLRIKLFRQAIALGHSKSLELIFSSQKKDPELIVLHEQFSEVEDDLKKLFFDIVLENNEPLYCLAKIDGIEQFKNLIGRDVSKLRVLYKEKTLLHVAALNESFQILDWVADTFDSSELCPILNYMDGNNRTVLEQLISYKSKNTSQQIDVALKLIHKGALINYYREDIVSFLLEYAVEKYGLSKVVDRLLEIGVKIEREFNYRIITDIQIINRENLDLKGYSKETLLQIEEFKELHGKYPESKIEKKVFAEIKEGKLNKATFLHYIIFKIVYDGDKQFLQLLQYIADHYLSLDFNVLDAFGATLLDYFDVANPKVKIPHFLRSFLGHSQPKESNLHILETLRFDKKSTDKKLENEKQNKINQLKAEQVKMEESIDNKEQEENEKKMECQVNQRIDIEEKKLEGRINDRIHFWQSQENKKDNSNVQKPIQVEEIKVKPVSQDLLEKESERSVEKERISDKETSTQEELLKEIQENMAQIDKDMSEIIDETGPGTGQTSNTSP